MTFRVDCENCHQPVPASHLELSTGWAKCPVCDNVFPIADAVPTFPRPEELLRRRTPFDSPMESLEVLERPFDARAIVKESNDSLLIHLPAYGMKAGTWLLLFFALFWNGFVLVWSGGAILAMGGGGGAAICFPLFSIPFWIVGAFLIGAVAWMRFGTKTVHLDTTDMNLQTRCLFWKRHRHVPREAVQCARILNRKLTTESGTTIPQLFLEIVYEGGTYALSGSSIQERDWLIATINQFLKKTA